MADHPDALSVELPAANEADLRRIYARLGADMLPVKATGTLLVEGVLVHTFRKAGALELFIAGEDDAYRITPAAVEAAHAVETRLDGIASPRVRHRENVMKEAPDVAAPRGNLALFAIALGAAFLFMGAMATWALAGAEPGQAARLNVVVAALYRIGGTAFAIGAFMVPGIACLACGWFLRKAGRRTGLE